MQCKLSYYFSGWQFQPGLGVSSCVCVCVCVVCVCASWRNLPSLYRGRVHVPSPQPVQIVLHLENETS